MNGTCWSAGITRAALVHPGEICRCSPHREPPRPEHERIDLVVAGRGVGDDRAAVLVDCRGVDARHYAVGVAAEAAQLLWGQDVDDE